jgi:hypothetical protein
MERLNAGYCKAVNPFNANQVKRVSLLPPKPLKAGTAPEDAADVIVFWTRDPRKILARAEELENKGYRFYVMVTVTGYPVLLEPSMTRTSKVLNAIKELAQKIGADRVIWRYDPILLTSITDEDFHQKNFDFLAQSLSGSVKRVIISIYDEYKGAKKRLDVMEKLGQLQMLNTGDVFTQEILPRLLTGFAKSAKATGMEIQSCARKEDYKQFGIKPGACIDAE